MADLTDRARAALCNAFVFDLSDLLERWGTEAGVGLGARLMILDAAHAKLDRLASSDPTNAEWLRDLAIPHAKTAQVSEFAGDPRAPRGAFRRAREGFARVAAISSGAVQPLFALALCCFEIGRLSQALGDEPAMNEARAESHGILQQLTKAGIELPPHLKQVLDMLDRAAGG